jgi:8-oxo-dGTP pyrophosphatase MutT (NUDIX family)
MKNRLRIMHYPPLVATDARDFRTYPLDFETIHEQGIPHRAVHIEIVNNQENYFIWQRNDGRLEIPGGHVDWVEGQSRPETYEESALREIAEELNCSIVWNLHIDIVYLRLKEFLFPIIHTINQIPSLHGNNNEWVFVYSLKWQSEWGDPCNIGWRLSDEGQSPRWLSLSEIERFCLEKPMSINAALRLLLRRRGVLVPLIKHAQ